MGFWLDDGTFQMASAGVLFVLLSLGVLVEFLVVLALDFFTMVAVVGGVEGLLTVSW